MSFSFLDPFSNKERNWIIIIEFIETITRFSRKNIFCINIESFCTQSAVYVIVELFSLSYLISTSWVDEIHKALIEILDAKAFIQTQK